MAGADYLALNLAARLRPQEPDNELTRPCIEIGGVRVYVYYAPVGDGVELRISAHSDTADGAVLTEQGPVPTRVIVDGTDVFQTGL